MIKINIRVGIYTFLFIFISRMDTIEIFKSITSQPKWYAGIKIGESYMSTQAANRIKARFTKGTLSEKKIEQIFAHFGYIKTTKLWEKKQVSN